MHNVDLSALHHRLTRLQAKTDSSTGTPVHLTCDLQHQTGITLSARPPRSKSACASSTNAQALHDKAPDANPNMVVFSFLLACFSCTQSGQSPCLPPDRPLASCPMTGSGKMPAMETSSPVSPSAETSRDMPSVWVDRPAQSPGFLVWTLTKATSCIVQPATPLSSGCHGR